MLLMCYPDTMIVTLPTQLETWVSSQVQAGVYADTNEVLVEALELLKMQVALEEQVAFLSQASAEPLCVNWCSKVKNEIWFIKWQQWLPFTMLMSCIPRRCVMHLALTTLVEARWTDLIQAECFKFAT